MEVRIQSIHFDASEQLQAFIQKKVSKLEKYYEDIILWSVWYDVFRADTSCEVFDPDGFLYPDADGASTDYT